MRASSGRDELASPWSRVCLPNAAKCPRGGARRPRVGLPSEAPSPPSGHGHRAGSPCTSHRRGERVLGNVAGKSIAPCTRSRAGLGGLAIKRRGALSQFWRGHPPPYDGKCLPQIESVVLVLNHRRVPSVPLFSSLTEVNSVVPPGRTDPASRGLKYGPGYPGTWPRP